jgi:hypothetical protein
MTIGAGNSILASDYNTIQTNVANVLGTGSGNTGYGQAVSSSQVSTGNTITASQMQNLKSDLDKIAFHQNNAASTAPSVVAGGSIAASDWSTYSSQATSLSGTRFTLSSSQATATDGVTPTMSGWNSTRTHDVTVTFATANDARYFFNAGGEIRIVPSISGQATTKGSAWNSIFNSIGTMKFGYAATTAGVAGTSIGWYNLTNSNQTILTYTSSGATYVGNVFSVQAYCNVASNTSGTANILYLTITYNDAGNYFTGGNTIDENVDGTTTSRVQHYRATGSYVAVTAPTITGSTIA